MQSKELERLLTPAAKQMLEGLMDDLRIQLLDRAAAYSARETGVLREISVADLARSFSRLQLPRPEFARGMINTALSVYSWLGAIFAVAGIGLFLVNLALQDSQVFLSQRTALVLVTAGASLAVAAIYARHARESLLFARLTRHKLQSRLETGELPIGRFLFSWTQLEAALRTLASVAFGESAAKRPLSELLHDLRTSNQMSDSTHNSLIALLKLRNQVVHSPTGLSTTDLLEAVNRAEQLAASLSKETRRSPS
jgi:hypothetical protein